MTYTPDQLWTVLPWAALAVVMCAALYFILGRNVGAQGVKSPTNDKIKAALPKLPMANNGVKPPPLPANLVMPVGITEIVIPEEGSEIAKMLERLQAEHPRFSTEVFSKGVETSFKVILEAFAKADKETLGKWTEPNVLKGFEKEIAKREADKLKVHCSLEGIEKIAISGVKQVAGKWQISVDISSWQMNYLTDTHEEVVLGNASRTFFKDRWVFQSDTTSKDAKLSWKLAQTEVL